MVLQVVLKFKENFWQKVVQEADFFGHVPQSGEGRGHCGLFYDLGRKVKFYDSIMFQLLLFLNSCQNFKLRSKFSLLASILIYLLQSPWKNLFSYQVLIKSHDLPAGQELEYKSHTKAYREYLEIEIERQNTASNMRSQISGKWIP